MMTQTPHFPKITSDLPSTTRALPSGKVAIPAYPSRRRRPNGPILQRTIGPLGRKARAINPVPQGDALGWANGWAFGPLHHRQQKSLAPEGGRLFSVWRTIYYDGPVYTR